MFLHHEMNPFRFVINATLLNSRLHYVLLSSMDTNLGSLLHLLPPEQRSIFLPWRVSPNGAAKRE